MQTEIFEYLVLEMDTPDEGDTVDRLNTELTEMGMAGWELVSVVPSNTADGEKSRFYFKRAHHHGGDAH